LVTQILNAGMPFFGSLTVLTLRGLSLSPPTKLMPFGCLLLNKDKCVTYGRRGWEGERNSQGAGGHLFLTQVAFGCVCDIACCYYSYCFCFCCACAKPIEECSDAAALFPHPTPRFMMIPIFFWGLTLKPPHPSYIYCFFRELQVLQSNSSSEFRNFLQAFN